VGNPIGLSTAKYKGERKANENNEMCAYILAKPNENNKMYVYTLAKPNENNKMYVYTGAKPNENNKMYVYTGLFSFVLAFFQLRGRLFPGLYA
jgi:hypothetical protein